MDIEELVIRCKNGDEKAMSEVVTGYKQLIYTIAYRLLNDYDMSLDICQETFIKAFQNIYKLKKPNKFRGIMINEFWFRNIMSIKNHCFFQIRLKF